MTVNPRRRPTALRALQHPWLAGLAPRAPSFLALPGLRRRLNYYAAQTPAWRACAYIACLGKTQCARGNFGALDADRDGKLSENDLIQTLIIGKEDAKMLLNALDIDGDGCVQYSEFLPAVCGDGLSMCNMEAAFVCFDTDGDGLMSEQDLRLVLGNSFCGIDTKRLFQAWDVDGDGVIGLADWLLAVHGTTNDKSRVHITDPTLSPSEPYADKESSSPSELSTSTEPESDTASSDSVYSDASVSSLSPRSSQPEFN